MKLTQPSITFFLLSLASTAQATKVTRRGGSDYGGERRLKSKSTKAPSGGKGSKSQAPSLAPSSAPTRSVSIDTTCLVQGTSIEGSSTVFTGDASNELKFGVCDFGLYVPPTQAFSSVRTGEELADGADALEAAGYGTYPLLFGAAESNAQWSLEAVDGALNNEAYCVTLGSEAGNKGSIVEYNEDVNLSSNEIDSFSYDYYVDDCGVATPPCGNEFYLNIYTTIAAGGVFYSCKYDYVPDTANGEEGNWYTFDIDVANPSVVSKYGLGQGNAGDCPPDPNTAIQNGYVLGNGTCQNWVINVGDSSAGDNNMKGCIDNIRPSYSMAGSFTFDLQGQTI